MARERIVRLTALSRSRVAPGLQGQGSGNAGDGREEQADGGAAGERKAAKSPAGFMRLEGKREDGRRRIYPLIYTKPSLLFLLHTTSQETQPRPGSSPCEKDFAAIGASLSATRKLTSENNKKLLF